MNRSSWLAALGLAGAVVVSACGYRPGALLAEPQRPDRGTRQVGCLDVAVAVGGDAEAPRGDPVVTIDFGNRCDQRVEVDLTALRVDAEYPGAVRWRLAPYDPRGEIRSLPLDARGHGRERIELVAPADLAMLPVRMCVDVGGIAPAAAPAAALCFIIDGDGLVLEHEGVS